ncbi:isoprenyl transferase [Desulfurivibrio alkaliphilus]|uniref:Isoprenyl transferase n=1 Tax=Desulfurivibrio alkaliphilus (strain DSM 19089 / UNIQEM U267 / AHT2) TaxID=589865 RepID=D6Z299_DESAT|nr:isoprenyl transferase [Desulfurivibrio alkaliphilus]ADH85674.1 undecaprenyl diphosphate synthase [Desulfurivibrio alkaliphilus AHT 2]
MTHDPANLPRHVAIIMDGNGRWAHQQGKPRIMGHQAGVRSVQAVVRCAGELNLEALTLYAFSTENWQRPGPEVEGLMGLLKTYLESQLEQMVQNRVRLRTCGHIDRLPTKVRRILENTIRETADNDGLILNLALSYGGRDELIRAARKLAARVADGELTPAQINEQTLAAELDTAELPDPDLLIRTGGERRLSNFLLWQLSYSELYFTRTLWPDFGREQFLAALTDYQQRQRRFGRLNDQPVES